MTYFARKEVSVEKKAQISNSRRPKLLKLAKETLGLLESSDLADVVAGASGTVSAQALTYDACCYPR